MSKLHQKDNSKVKSPNTTFHHSPKEKEAIRKKNNYEKKKNLLLELQTENTIMKERILQLETENRQLQMENNHLKARMDISAMEFQIAKNTQTLLKALPEKSPNHKSILYFLSRLGKKRDYGILSHFKRYLLL